MQKYARGRLARVRWGYIKARQAENSQLLIMRYQGVHVRGRDKVFLLKVIYRREEKIVSFLLIDQEEADRDYTISLKLQNVVNQIQYSDNYNHLFKTIMDLHNLKQGEDEPNLKVLTKTINAHLIDSIKLFKGQIVFYQQKKDTKFLW